MNIESFVVESRNVTHVHENKLAVSSSVPRQLRQQSFKLLWPLAPIPNSKGNPVVGGVKYTVVGKIGDFQRISPFISETVRERPMVTMER